MSGTGKDGEALRYIRTVVVTGTAASFTLRNPVLLRGQLGYESDTRKMKVGNGTTAWSSLGYVTGLGGGGGVTDHGALTGLTDDDHSQYHNDSRGDARYYTKSQVDTSLAGKSDTGHGHVIADVTGLQTALDGKQAAGSYAAATHSHAISDVTGLQTALDGKQAAGSYAAATHSHAIADVTGLQTALDGKQAAGSYAAASHTHTASQISDSTAAGRTLLTAADAAAQRSALSLGTAAQVNTGTGSGDVPTITQADARYAPLSAWTAMSYTGGNQTNATTSYADIHSSAGWDSLAPGDYEAEVQLTYNVNATTTGCRFGVNGTATQTWLHGTVNYNAGTGDRDGSNIASYDSGNAVPSSALTNGNRAVMSFRITISVTGNLRIRFAASTAVANALTVTNVIGRIRRLY